MKSFLAIPFIAFLSFNQSYACSSYDCTQNINICSTNLLTDCNYDSGISFGNYSNENIDIYLNEVYGPSPEEETNANYRNEGRENFDLILAESKLSDDEKATLRLRYEKLKGYIPQKDRELNNSEGKNSPETFLRAIDLFYGQKYKESYDLFSLLAKNAGGFTAEYALYLAGRSAHSMALFNWDGYSDMKAAVDLAWVGKMEASYKKYQDQYPSGRYNESVRNMERRIAVLKNGPAAFYPIMKTYLDEAYVDKMAPQVKKERLHALLFEYDYVVGKTPGLLEANIQLHPMYWPFYINYILREYVQTPKEKIELAEKKLDLDKTAFEGYPLEWALSKAAFVYYKKNYEELITFINAAPVKSYSLETLKGKAFIALKRYDEAKATLLAAKNYELLFYAYYYAGDVEKTMLAASKMPFNAEYAEAIIKNLPSDRLIAVLKNKDLLPEYKPLLEDQAVQKALHMADWKSLSQFNSKKYPTIQRSAKLLERKPLDRPSLINVINAQTTTDLGFYNFFNSCPEMREDEMKRREAMNLKIPLDYMATVLDGLDKKKSYPFEARLLSLAIKCFKGSGMNCSLGYYLGDDSFTNKYPMAKRAEWFKRLQSKYKKTQYAQNTAYYY